LLIDWGGDLAAIQDQEHFHRCVADSLVAVDEGVVHDELNPSAAALSTSVGCKSAPANVATGCARADSRRPRSA
jgi:hypothetical protein